MGMGSYGFMRPRESWDVWRYHPTIIHLENPQANLKEMLSFSGNSKQIFLYSNSIYKNPNYNKQNQQRQKRVMRYSWHDPMTWLSLTLISLTVQKETATDSFERTPLKLRYNFFCKLNRQFFETFFIIFLKNLQNQCV